MSRIAICPIEGNRIHGRLDLLDGSRYRVIEVERVHGDRSRPPGVESPRESRAAETDLPESPVGFSLLGRSIDQSRDSMDS